MEMQDSQINLAHREISSTTTFFWWTEIGDARAFLDQKEPEAYFERLKYTMTYHHKPCDQRGRSYEASWDFIDADNVDLLTAIHLAA